jgi:hypothetical protein
MTIKYDMKIPALTLIWVILFSVGCAEQGPQEDAAQGPPPGVMAMGGLNIERGLVANTDGATPGYVMFCPLLSGMTYLIDLDGNVVHTWESKYGPSGWLYLKDNGNLIRGGRDPEAPVFDGGGQGGIFQEIGWDGEIIWEYQYSGEEYQTHHDIAYMPNGNYLAISWEPKSVEEAVQAGRRPETIPQAGLWPDKIVEIEPVYPDGGKVVWEWHMWDHMIQDQDDAKDNYGTPADHPELLDINSHAREPRVPTVEELAEDRSRNNANTNDTPYNQGSDVYHLNAIDYNAALDQIIFSSPGLDEIFVIDHSTTTEEAAGHTGGRWGKGGDYLYRWGNPQNYQRGDSTNQVLGGQHDVKWVHSGYPGEGNIMVFNNVVQHTDKGHSAVLEFAAPLSEEGYSISDGQAFGPSEMAWSYTDTSQFFSAFISGAHRMQNGNTFITEGAKGRYFEVTPDGEIVWDYLTPFSGNARMPDGTFPQPVGPFIYATFRATHISADHPALEGRELSPLDPQPPVDLL